MPDPTVDEARAFFAAPRSSPTWAWKSTPFGEGECATSLAIAPRHLQHSGQVHAGVLTTLADHTAGAAAQTLAPEGTFVATVELKISLLRPAKGERLVCRGRVLKPGRQLSFVEAEVHCVEGGKEHLVAKVSATMTMISQKNLV